jgi:Uma2 family endonuclease
MVRLYVWAGVREVWVIDVERQAIRVFRNPDSAGYQTSFTVVGDSAVRPEALDGRAISVQALFPT